MSQVYLRPAEGLIVRDPATRAPLAAEGEWKPRSSYWDRRLLDGDVVETEPPVVPASKTNTPTED